MPFLTYGVDQILFNLIWLLLFLFLLKVPFV